MLLAAAVLEREGVGPNIAGSGELELILENPTFRPSRALAAPEIDLDVVASPVIATIIGRQGLVDVQVADRLAGLNTAIAIQLKALHKLREEVLDPLKTPEAEEVLDLLL